MDTICPALSSRKKMKNKTSRILPGMVTILIPLLLFSIIYLFVTLHHMSNRITEINDYTGQIESRTTLKQLEFVGKLDNLEKKVSSLEKSPALMREVEVLSSRMKILEKHFESLPFRKKLRAVASSDRSHYYEVKEGDTLFQISKKYDLSVEEMARLNGIREQDFISVGQKLVVPK